MTKKYAKARSKGLQVSGMNRKEARRAIYGPTWKEATQYGKGVQRAITTVERKRREALRGEVDREAEAGGPEE